jgi:hypothetical protein
MNGLERMKGFFLCLLPLCLMLAAACGGGGGGDEDAQDGEEEGEDTQTDDARTDDPAVDDPVVDDVPAEEAPPPDTGEDVATDPVEEDVAEEEVEPDVPPPPDCVYAPADVPVLQHSAIFRDQAYDAAQDLVTIESGLCGTNPVSAEVVYGIEITDATEIYIETDCGWNCQIVLMKDGCTSDHVVQCETTSGDEAFLASVEPGFYYVFVEGSSADDTDTFDIMINIHHMGGMSPCAVDQALTVMDPANCEDPWMGSPYYGVVLDAETLSPDDVDNAFVDGVEGCTSDAGHVGGAPDRIYQFEITGTEDRDVSIEVNPSYWGTMIYVTTDPCGALASVVACADGFWGGAETIETTLAPGVYYLVVDGEGEEVFGDNAWGAFSIDLRVYDDACNT